jgi:hypothetical protein
MLAVYGFDRRQEVAEQLPEGLFHRCLPFIGYLAAAEFRGTPRASVQRSGEVRLSVLHPDTTISSAAITAPVARIFPIAIIWRLSLLSCHLRTTGERQYNEERG